MRHGETSGRSLPGILAFHCFLYTNFPMDSLFGNGYLDADAHEGRSRLTDGRERFSERAQSGWDDGHELELGSLYGSLAEGHGYAS